MATSLRFPQDLPIPLRDSYSETFEEIHRALPMESGTARRRARMRTAPRRFSLSFILSQVEFTIFDQWWQNTILGGEKQFDIQLLDEDDVDPLVWYTVNIVDGQYNLNVNEAFDYEVSFSVRAVSAAFADRPAGTDTLGGRTSIGMSAARGNILVFTPYRASSRLGMTSVKAVFGLPPLRGAVSFYMAARARLPKPLAGTVMFSFTGKARFPDGLVSYQEESRQWQGYGWMRPLAGQDINTTQDLVSREWMGI